MKDKKIRKLILTACQKISWWADPDPFKAPIQRLENGFIYRGAYYKTVDSFMPRLTNDLKEYFDKNN